MIQIRLEIITFTIKQGLFMVIYDIRKTKFSALPV